MLVQNRLDGLFSCNLKRPAAIFGEFLAKEVQNDGDSATCYGTIPGPDGSMQVPFMANTCMSRDRKLNTLSTVGSATLVTTAVTSLVDDDTTDEVQQVRITGPVIRPESRVLYAQYMDFVDKADVSIMGALSGHRNKHWTTAYMQWVFTMLLAVNTRKLYQSSTGLLLDVTLHKWLSIVRRDLASAPQQQEPHPELVKGPKGLRYACRSCRLECGTRRVHDTVWTCSLCGPICKTCHDSGVHQRYADTNPARIRAYRTTLLASNSSSE